jgi:uncharacterized Zn-binding protein involved in type VI secretion
VGVAAIVQGDKITGICPNHLIPSASGTAPAGPQDFSAPLSQNLVNTVLIAGKPAAVVGAFGYNSPPHKGIVDPPFGAPNMQMGRITSGSPAVLIGGKPAATVISTATCCATPGTLAPGVSTVLIG